MFNLQKQIFPKPKIIEDKNKSIIIASFASGKPSINYNRDDDMLCEAAKLISSRLYELSLAVFDCENNYEINLIVDAENEKLTGYGDEAYFVDVNEKKTILCGKTNAGVFYAATTFCQLLYIESDKLMLPLSYIFDYPDFKYRGHFIECEYGTEFLSKESWFNLIDYMAKYKINNITVGLYGCWTNQYDNKKAEFLFLPIKKYPKLKSTNNIKYYSVKEKKWIYKEDLTPAMFKEDFLGDLMAYGKRKNVTIKPLFNSLGHNTLIPRIMPDISSVDEEGNPYNSAFCTKNDKTYDVMFNIYDEIIDRYLVPNDIHEIEIGLDEIPKSSYCRCEKCRDKEKSEILVDYIIKLCKYLKQRGMERIYIYHDILYHELDIINEDLKERFIKEEIYDEVVIDWWSYEDPAHLFWDRADGVNNIFHSVIKPLTGFYHYALSTENNENIRACVKLAKELNFEGVEAYSSWDITFDKNYLTLADISWNASELDDFESFNERYALKHFPKNVPAAKVALRAMSDIMKDETCELYMNRMLFKLEYYFYSFEGPQKIYPRNFPGEVYSLIKENEKEYINYLDYILQKSKTALDFFENNGESSLINDAWKLVARHYYTLSDEYMSLYSACKLYNNGCMDAHQVILLLERLYKQREYLMGLAEVVKHEENSHIYFRNMSVFRQYIVDLLKYFKKEVSKGNKPELDVTDLRYATGKELEFLQ